MSDENTTQMGRLNITGETSGYVTPSQELRSSGETAGAPQRKADLAYNHLELVPRPALPCKAKRHLINVTANYFKLNAPTTIRYVTFRLDFEVENSRNRTFEPVKKEKLAELFKKFHTEHRSLFPRKDEALVYNGTDMIYCPPNHTILPKEVNFTVQRGAMRNGRQGRDQKGKVTITPIGLSELPTVQVDSEQDRCAIMQFLDCVLTQEHRFDLTGRAARFVQHGHSLFKIPLTPEERRRDVKPIGNGEEVWLGLHSAVKCDSEDLMLNADTSGSIFKSQSLSLIDFYAQVVRGYTSSLERTDFSRLTIDDRYIYQLSNVLKGTKLILRVPGQKDKVKKFDKFSRPADRETFRVDGREYTVARFYMEKYDIQLRCPSFPCLQFYNKMNRQSSSIPMEFFYTLDEPTRFKGKLTDQQLDIFVKAVCQDPKEKKERITRFVAGGGEYLGATQVMREWGVSLERTMVNIENCPVLPLPHIRMNASEPNVAVDEETCQFKITETRNGQEIPIKPIETNPNKIVLALVIVNDGPIKQNDLAHGSLMRNTLRAYGLDVYETVGTFSGDIVRPDDRRSTETNGRFLTENVMKVRQFCDGIEKNLPNGQKVQPIHIFVFPRRNALTYAAIKYHFDVLHGVASQCTVRKTFEKLAGNCITNTSAQNLLLKILAKVGAVEYRLSPHQHKNIERIQNPEDPVLVLGVDVSHPGKEERFEAIEKHEKATGANTQQKNKYRGQHEKLPTARPAGQTLFKDIGFYDCPRSVVSVVGTLDVQGSKYGVSSRVQRLGQEETVNMIEPFRERIQDFYDNVGSMPKHIIMYRDGASDTQVKKIAYEELESLERAMEALGIGNGKCTVTYIMAAKRHHTRFFRANLDDMPKDAPHLNCPPGTLVEQKIVSRNKWDFYLQSHYGNLGTALPTRYTVVRDDWNVSPAFVQTIVFAHCFGNARCPRPLCIPVPLHYAHLAAKRSKVLFDHYKINPSEEYIRSREDLVREEFERQAVTPHPNIRAMKGMHYA